MRIEQFMILTVVALVLSGCATNSISNNPAKVVDSGKSNIVLLSYEVTLPTENPLDDADLMYAYLCDSAANSYKLSGCLQTRTLKKTSSSYSVKSIGAFKQKYGEYSYTHILYTIPGDKESVTACQDIPVKKGGGTKLKASVCNTTKRIKYETKRIALPQPIEISVQPGAGCFLGHVAIKMIESNIVDYDFSNNLEFLDLSLADNTMRDKLKSHVTRSCSVTL